jgi:hypothetical protein
LCEQWVLPQSELIFYKEGETVLFDEWLKALPVKVQTKCLSLVGLLRSQGHELRRPIADFLRDGIYELRPSYQGVNYRILYFFSGKYRCHLAWFIEESGSSGYRNRPGN